MLLGTAALSLSGLLSLDVSREIWKCVEWDLIWWSEISFSRIT